MHFELGSILQTHMDMDYQKVFGISMDEARDSINNQILEGGRRNKVSNDESMSRLTFGRRFMRYVADAIAKGQ